VRSGREFLHTLGGAPLPCARRPARSSLRQWASVNGWWRGHITHNLREACREQGNFRGTQIRGDATHHRAHAVAERAALILVSPCLAFTASTLNCLAPKATLPRQRTTHAPWKRAALQPLNQAD